MNGEPRKELWHPFPPRFASSLIRYWLLQKKQIQRKTLSELSGDLRSHRSTAVTTSSSRYAQHHDRKWVTFPRPPKLSVERSLCTHVFELFTTPFAQTISNFHDRKQKQKQIKTEYLHRLHNKSSDFSPFYRAMAYKECPNHSPPPKPGFPWFPWGLMKLRGHCARHPMHPPGCSAACHLWGRSCCSPCLDKTRHFLVNARHLHWMSGKIWRQETIGTVRQVWA